MGRASRDSAHMPSSGVFSIWLPMDLESSIMLLCAFSCEHHCHDDFSREALLSSQESVHTPSKNPSHLMWILRVHLSRNVWVNPLKHGDRACRCVPLPGPRGDQHEDVHRRIGPWDVRNYRDALTGFHRTPQCL